MPDSTGSPAVFAVVPAAGVGARLGRGNKAAVELAGEPLVVHSLRTIAAYPAVVGGALVVHADDVELAEREWCPAGWRVVVGGATRQASVAAGLATATVTADDLILVHDAARPLLTAEDLTRVIEAAATHGGATLASPVADTLWREAKSEGAPRAGERIDRERLHAVETPQVFRRAWLDEAHAAGGSAAATGSAATGSAATDDVGLVSAQGHPVHLVSSRSPNFKVTSAVDLELAEVYVRSRRSPT